MSETKHTPEPWHIEKTVHAKDADGGYETWISAEWGINEWHGLAFTFGDEDSEDQAIANARRIVACVNACSSCSDEDLADDCVNKMRKDRDDLLNTLYSITEQGVSDQHRSREDLLEEKVSLAVKAVNRVQNKNHCLQCGAELSLVAVSSDPNYPHSNCVPGNKILELTAQRDELLAALTHAATDYIDQNGSVPSWWTDKIRQMVKPHA